MEAFVTSEHEFLHQTNFVLQADKDSYTYFFDLNGVTSPNGPVSLVIDSYSPKEDSQYIFKLQAMS